MKKIISILLCAVMIFSIIPFFGEQASAKSIYDDIEVSTLEELNAACEKNNVIIKVMNDITGSNQNFLVPVTGNNVWVDLNGYTISNNYPQNTMFMSGVFDVYGSDIIIENGIIGGSSIYQIAVYADAQSHNLTMRDISTDFNIGVLLSSQSDTNGYTEVISCRMESADGITDGAAVRCTGKQALILDNVVIYHGDDNMSGPDHIRYSIYPAIYIGKETSVTIVELVVNKRADGKILQCLNTSYNTYGYLTAPDAQILVDAFEVMPTEKLPDSQDESAGQVVPIKLIEGGQLIVSSEMTAIPEVSCSIEIPMLGEEVSYEPWSNSSKYYSAAHNIGNIYNDVVWQVWDDELDRWDMDAVEHGDCFEEGKTYRVLFDVTAQDGYFFAEGAAGYLNGELADDFWVGGSKKTFRIIKEFPAVQKIIGWFKDPYNNWYYFDSNGVKQTDWQKIDGKWYYLGTDGIMRSGLTYVDGAWYFLNNSMQTGWQHVGNKWFYFGSNGAMQKGWLNDGGKWYYLDDYMRTGWQKVDGKWYYLGSNGAMQTGWQKINGIWYYLNNAMVTGWQKINGKTYYFKSNGAMAANEWCGGWWLNADGSWTYPYQATWRKGSKGWWYGDDSGWYAKGRSYIIDNVTYTFDAAGWLK